MPMLPPPLTEACEDRDFVEWHRGCPWCAVWVLRVEQPAVMAQLTRSRASLAPWLLPRYARQPHVTLAYRGLMAVEGEHAHATFGEAQLRADVQALQAAPCAPFALQVQGTGSFSTVPYLAVEACAPLQAVHEVLMAQTPYPGWHYVPHITLGHYGCQVPMATVLTALQASVPSGALWEGGVPDLWLARYRSNDIAGPLYFEGRFDLRTQRYEAQPGALLSL